ncbi:MAG: type III-B CRISPR-associated protein Cas10/Cmr2 [Magnetococcales bacterium]|nr:type III-B CRISPR-associated protein Cas10/Cmr2 [Magnetococcales bacterium]
MDEKEFWRLKVMQLLHDPPGKPFYFHSKGGHEKAAMDWLRFLEIFHEKELEYIEKQEKKQKEAKEQGKKGRKPKPPWPKEPDRALAGADRPVLSPPRWEKPHLNLHWPGTPIITHPLMPGWHLDVRPGSVTDLKGKVRPHEEKVRENFFQNHDPEDDAEEETAAKNAATEELEDDAEEKAATEEAARLLPGDNRDRFMRLWRCLREQMMRNGDHPLLWREMPAETRCPDHSIWDHTRMASSLAFVNREDKKLLPSQQPWLFKFSMGPASRFIQTARTGRDLWMGSMLLSDLSWHAMRPIVMHYGPDAILYPDLRGNHLVDVHLGRENREWLPQDADPVTYAALLPNTFTALLPRGADGTHLHPLETIAAKAEEAMKNRWEELAGLVFDWMKRLGLPDVDWQTQWKDHHACPLICTWSAVPWIKPDRIENANSLLGPALPCQDWKNQKPVPEDDKEALKERAQRLEPWIPRKDWNNYESARRVFGRSNLTYLQLERGFDYAPTHHKLAVLHRMAKERRHEPPTLNPGGVPCTQCSVRPALGGAARGEHLEGMLQRAKTFWSHGKLDPERRGNERLCPVCAIRRFLVPAGRRDTELAGINPLWAGISANVATVTDHDDTIRLPFPATAAIAAQEFLAKLAVDPDLALERQAVVDAAQAAGIPRSHFPHGLPRLSRACGKERNTFLEYDPQLTLFPTTAEVLWSRCPPSDHDKLRRLTRKIAHLRHKADKKLNGRPATMLAVIAMDADGMGRLLLGDEERIHARWRDVIHPDFVKKMETHPHLQRAGWIDLLDAHRLMGPSLHAFVSRALAEFTNRIVPWVVEQEFGGRLIYCGGDELLCLAPAADALNLAARLRQLFSAGWIIDTQGFGTKDEKSPWGWRSRKENSQAARNDTFDPEAARQRFHIPLPKEHATDPKTRVIRLPVLREHLAKHVAEEEESTDWRPTAANGEVVPLLGKGASLSAGIVFAHFKTPMSELLHQAHHLLEEHAKERMNRNAVAASHFSRNGVKTTFAMKWSGGQGQGPDQGVASGLMNRIRSGFAKGVIPGRLPYKLRDHAATLSAAWLALDREKQEERDEKRQQLLTGLLHLALDGARPPGFADILNLWHEGIAHQTESLMKHDRMNAPKEKDMERSPEEILQAFDREMDTSLEKAMERSVDGLLLCRALARADQEDEDE